MAYQVIARKWRPQTFEEVTGQEAITRTLRNAVEHDRLHHAYIFSGARGVGKTTTARLLAKALNCHKTDRPNATPCRTDAADACVSCREIAESRSIDVLEFDAASHTGVDDIREIILESININPARDRFKIFIIDEVHMLSNSSFNALLKTLEEPPPRVEFIMATTELHKLPDTILSRCQEFEFRTIALQKIFERIKSIAEAENIEVSDEALKEIARAGEGSMRDAQSAFDQVISFSGSKIGIAEVSVALGIAGAEMLTRVSRAISENKPAEALKVVDELIARGQDLRNFCRDLLAFFRDLLVYKMAGESENLLDTTVLSREELQTSAAPFSEADLIRFFNSLSDTETKLREAKQARYVLEIGLVKLIEMRRVAPVEKILERLAKLEGALANGGNFPVDAKPEESKPVSQSPASFEKPTPEKKTLTVDFPLDEVPFPVSSGTSFAAATAVAPAVEKTEDVKIERLQVEQIKAKEIKTAPEIINLPPAAVVYFEEPPNIFPDTGNETFFSAAATPPNDEPPKLSQAAQTWAERLASMPVKMSDITSEELEHVEDAWLDADYERKLLWSGDDLIVSREVSAFVRLLIEASQPNQKNSESFDNLSSAFAEKPKSSFVMPDFEEEEISNEMPVLPENPTDEQLWHYAENHPLVKKAMRIFRGKIIEVKQNPQLSG